MQYRYYALPHPELALDPPHNVKTLRTAAHAGFRRVFWWICAGFGFLASHLLHRPCESCEAKSGFWRFCVVLRVANCVVFHSACAIPTRSH